MKYIIIDDEPIARRGIEKLAGQIGSLKLVGSFENAGAAGVFMIANQVDLVFLDILKPIRPDRFKKAVAKALSYHEILVSEKDKNQVEQVESNFIFIKSERRYFKVDFKDILFIEALKDYVIIQTVKQRLITHLNLKAIHEMLPQTIFLKSNRSYIINKDHVDSFSNNDIFIDKYETAISNAYRDSLFEILMQ